MPLNSTPESGIAERLRVWRKSTLAMTQQKLAEATGVHVSAIRKYKNGHCVPDCESLLAIASTGVNLHWLLRDGTIALVGILGTVKGVGGLDMDEPVH